MSLKYQQQWGPTFRLMCARCVALLVFPCRTRIALWCRIAIHTSIKGTRKLTGLVLPE